MIATLTHLTLNTGHIVRSTRADVDQRAIDWLLPVIDAEGGPIPGMNGWWLDFYFPATAGRRSAGAAFFQISDEPGASKRPAVLGISCWRDDLAPSAWQQVTSGYAALQAPLQQAGLWRAPCAQPASTPWLAVWMTPFLALADAATATAFGDLERCLAWALAEAATTD